MIKRLIIAMLLVVILTAGAVDPVSAATSINASETSIQFGNVFIGDGTVLHNGYLYTLSQTVAADGYVHVLKVKADNFTDYLDYQDTTCTIGGRTACVVGGYLFTAEYNPAAQGTPGAGSKIYRRSLSTLAPDATVEPFSSLVTGFQWTDTLVTDGTSLYAFSVISSYYKIAKINPATMGVTLYNAPNLGGTVHTGIVDAANGHIYVATYNGSTNYVAKFQLSDMTVLDSEVITSSYHHDDAIQDANYLYMTSAVGEVRRWSKSDLSLTTYDIRIASLDGLWFLDNSSGDIIVGDGWNSSYYNAYVVPDSLDSHDTYIVKTTEGDYTLGHNEVISDGTNVYILNYDAAGVYWTRYPVSAFTPGEDTTPTMANEVTADDITTSTAVLTGNLTDTGSGLVTEVGFCYGLSIDPDIDDDNISSTTGSPYSIGEFTSGDDYGIPELTGLDDDTGYYVRAYAISDVGISYSESEYFYTAEIVTIPDPPTNVAATSNLTDNVTITWTKSAGATDYHVFRGATDLGSAGDVATFDDTGAAAPVITPGTATASNGTNTEYISLSISGATVTDTSYTYTVKAYNEAGASDASGSSTGKRTHGDLNYTWYRSSGVSDNDYSVLSGAVTAGVSDTTAPAGTITPGAAAATDGIYNYVRATISGLSSSAGATRYYYCQLSAAGADNATTTHDSGYRSIGSLSYQWQRSAADADEDYSNITGATSATLTDRSLDSLDKRYFKCVISATGVSDATTTGDQGWLDAAAVSKASNYIGFETVLQIAPVVLFLALLFGSGVSFGFGVRRQSLILALIGLLGVVVLITLFPAALTAFSNLLNGNW